MLFVGTGFANFVGATPPIWLESLGGILIATQPIINFYTLMTTPVVWKGLVDLLNKRQVNRLRLINQANSKQSVVPNKEIEFL
jgi:hypothetical protein